MTKKHTPKIDAAPKDKAVELADTELNAVGGGPHVRVFSSQDIANVSSATITDGTSNTFMVGETSNG